MIVDMSPGHRVSPSKGGATWQVTITKSAIPKEKTLAGVCLSLLGASPLVPTDTPPPFSSRLSRCSHLDCRAAIFSAGKRSEEHTSELQSLMRNSYAVFCLIQKTKLQHYTTEKYTTQTIKQTGE